MNINVLFTYVEYSKFSENVSKMIEELLKKEHLLICKMNTFIGKFVSPFFSSLYR